MAVIAGAIIGGVAQLGGGALNLAGKKKDAKAQKEQMKGQIITALSEQKRAQMEAKSKEKNLIAIVVVAFLLMMIVAISVVYLKQKKQEKSRA